MMDLAGNHLWQSTLFAAVATLFTLFFRKNYARVRYWIWLTASIKFLIPFSLFIAIGSSLDFSWRHSTALPPLTISYVENISQPFGSIDSSIAIPEATKPDRTRWIPVSLCATWLCGLLVVALLYLTRGRRLRTVLRRAQPLQDGRAHELLRNMALNSRLRTRIKLASSDSSMEPGVFGIFQPVLLLPEGMIERLDDSQLEAIIAHEVVHVRRHDNLLSAIHMMVEALFWFHPMIWWLGAKLVQERERACDEEVLRLGKNPQSYAEGILKVCEFYLESPLACVAGVTGSDMKKRIQAIMTHSIGGKLGLTKKLLLAVALTAALAIPVIIGLFNIPQSRAQSGVRAQTALSQASSIVSTPSTPKIQAEAMPSQTEVDQSAATMPQGTASNGTRATPSLDVASVKPTKQCGQVFSSGSGPTQSRMAINSPSFQPGGRYFGCGNLISLVRDAYKIDYLFQLSGGPGWKDNDLFQIDARVEGEPSTDQMRLMVQSLLEDRFKLKLHKETRDTQDYSLVVAEGGPKLQQAKDENGNPMIALPPPEVIEAKRKAAMSAAMSGDFSKMKAAPNPGTWVISGTMKYPSEMTMRFLGSAIGLDGLAKFLSDQMGRMVINKTGIAGLYDFDMEFSPDAGHSGIIMISPGAFSSRPSGASGANAGDTAPTAELSGPNILKALQDQFGLKLVPDKAPGEFFIIDSAEKPSEN